MKRLVIFLLIALPPMSAQNQRSSYDPAAGHATKSRDGFMDFALKQINPHDKDYGEQLGELRNMLVIETIDDIKSWALVVSLAILVLSFLFLLHQHREQNRRDLIAARFLAQYHNLWVDARSQVEEAIRRHNELVDRTNTSAEALPRAEVAPLGQAPTAPPGPNTTSDRKLQSASASPPKERTKDGKNGPARPNAMSQNSESEADLIAQISTLQQQLNSAHERERNLQKELSKGQRRASMAKETNIAG